MKIVKNPLELDHTDSARTVLDGLNDVARALGKVRAAADRQLDVLSRLERLDSKKTGDDELEKMVAELDRALEECTRDGASLSTGRYARFSCLASMWYKTGIRTNQRERVYIATMTSGSYLGPGDAKSIVRALKKDPKSRAEMLLAARRAAERTRAGMSAYLNRIKHVATFIERVRAVNAQTAMQKSVNAGQLAFLRTADAGLMSLYDVTSRIGALARQAAERTSEQDLFRRQHAQIEISQLVDEIDRIASQAEFNRMHLFQGSFARSSRVASMHFTTDDQKETKRIYIATMFARALDLKRYDGTMLTVSTLESAASAVALVNRALERINKERASLKQYIDFFETRGPDNPDIRIEKV